MSNKLDELFKSALEMDQDFLAKHGADHPIASKLKQIEELAAKAIALNKLHAVSNDPIEKENLSKQILEISTQAKEVISTL